MRYVISYDITEDRRRERVARALEDYGDRMQMSLFEAELEAAHLAALLERIAREIKNDEDSVIVYPLCSTCLGKTVRLGRKQQLDDRRAVVV